VSFDTINQSHHHNKPAQRHSNCQALSNNLQILCPNAFTATLVKSFHTLRFWQSHRSFVVPTCARTHLVTWDSATSTVRGLFSLKVSERANILQMGLTTVLSGSWNGFDAYFFFYLCRLCRPERNEKRCKYGIQMQAVVQPAGLRAVCAQCQRGGAHLQFSSTVHKLLSQQRKNLDRSGFALHY